MTEILKLLSTLFGIEELAILLQEVPIGNLIRQTNLIHPHGDKVGTEGGAGQLDIQQPVILQILISERHINQIIAREIIMGEYFLGQKLITARELQYLRIIKLQRIYFPDKLPLRVMPEDDMPLIVFP